MGDEPQDGGDNVTVHLVGGPPQWDGVEVRGVFDRWEIYEVPASDLGALLAVPGQVSQRAVYEPRPGGQRNVWHFRGWATEAPDDGGTDGDRGEG
ncbi:hypothetical protein [Nocardiopsis protaetiae]|uniref:hypothetical protein n=2 Tax=Nocardiopsidaceae TaxID=83676 RepID=UPI00387AE1B5